MKISTLFVFFISGYFSFSQGLLDGFLKGKNNITTAVSYSQESYDTYFVGDISTQNKNLGTIKTNSLSLFITGGITDYLDIVVSIPYIEAHANEGFWSDQNDFQDISIFLKGKFYDGVIGSKSNINLLAAVGVTTPVSNYIADAPVSIGNQSTQLDARIIAQLLRRKGFFINSQIGYSKRNNITIDRGYEVSVPDAWDYILRTGKSFNTLYADAWFQYQNSRSGTDIGPGVPFPTNEIDFARVGFTIFHPVPKVKDLGLAISGGFTLDGKNIGKSNRLTASIVYNFTCQNNAQLSTIK